MAGRNGVDKHTAFTGLMINNLFVVIAAFLTPFIMKVNNCAELDQAEPVCTKLILNPIE